jgi:hypothetical protein
MAPPAFDDDLSFSEGIEDLAVERSRLTGNRELAVTWSWRLE